jgi:hypothetical protein
VRRVKNAPELTDAGMDSRTCVVGMLISLMMVRRCQRSKFQYLVDGVRLRLSLAVERHIGS